MARRVTVCAGAMLKEFEKKNAPYSKIISVEHVCRNILKAVDTHVNVAALD